MAVIALCAAQGSPGVTTTALGLAFAWPHDVLVVDADPTGSSAVMAGWLRGRAPQSSGLIDLAFTTGPLREAVDSHTMPLDSAGRVEFLPGPQSPAQALACRDLWAPLRAALADQGTRGRDVIVDAGQLGLPGSPRPLLDGADLTLLVTRTHLPAVAGARAWAETVVREQPWRNPGLLLVGPGNPYGARNMSQVLGLPVIATVAHDPATAAVYHRGEQPPRYLGWRWPRRRFETSALVRSLRAASTAISTHLNQAPSRAPIARTPVTGAPSSRPATTASPGTNQASTSQPGTSQEVTS
ncbi:hypothetical protein ACO229_06645 [Promicromonospora sp. MS192]|uniref:hypothetical protein n=1 Tax=Promicromonospora sp. MS192 TaxID=3412684 RepID=UPI003C2D9BD8